MNVFLLSWNVSDLNPAGILKELSRFPAIYSSLDPTTLCSYSSRDKRIFLASICAAATEVTPREYSHRSRAGVTLFCGLPVDPDNEFAAHRAAELAAHFDHAANRLEGTYAVVRICEQPTQIEIQTDLLSGQHIYYLRLGDGWIFSNSVLLIERVAGYRALDPLGVSMYLRFSQALGDRSLRDGIRLIPPAQRWTWSTTTLQPRKTGYYPLSQTGDLKHRRLTSRIVSDLATQLAKPLTSLGSHFRSIVCPLTGGKDSRVVASLVIASETPARFLTYGDPEGGDARIAADIARTFDLDHEHLPILGTDVLSDWDNSVTHCIRATDGMRSLYLLAGLSKSKALFEGSRDIYLWGAGGELARAYYGYPPFTRRNLTTTDVEAIIRKSGPADGETLILPEAAGLARSWQNEFIRETADLGVDLRDIPDIWGNHIVDGRRIGNNGRGLAATRDTFTPFVTRAFIEATFSIAPIRRLTEPLHFALTRYLVPDLHRMPFANGNWRPQNAVANRVAMRAAELRQRIKHRLKRLRDRDPVYFYHDPMFDRLGWFENKREEIRQLALDTPGLAVWDYVDRRRFETIMDAKTHPATRSRSLQLLYIIATLVYYESDAERQQLAHTSFRSRTGT